MMGWLEGDAIRIGGSVTVRFKAGVEGRVRPVFVEQAAAP